MRARLISLSFATLIFLVSTVNWAYAKDFALEKEYTLNLVVSPKDLKGQPGITVSGLCGHSSYAVDRIEVVKKNQTMNILILLAKPKPGMSGAFSKWIPLVDDVNSITLGEENAVIWTREAP